MPVRGGFLGGAYQRFGAMSGAIPVNSDEGLRGAIGRYAALGRAGEAQGVGSGAGCEIVRVAPFAIRSPIVIPETCNGLRITAPGLVPLIVDAAMDYAFLIEGQNVTIENLLLLPQSQDIAAALAVQIGTADFAGAQFRLLHSYILADRVFDDPSMSADGVRLFDIDHEVVSDSPAGDPVVLFNASECAAMLCRLQDAGGDAFQIGAGADRCRITVNDLGGGDYTSTGSNGFNTFSANSGVGVITADPSDDVTGGNTA